MFTTPKSPLLPILALLLLFAGNTLANPAEHKTTAHRRTYPYFPDQPPSCQLCKRDYDSINNCAEAAVVFENVTQIIFNPGGFIDVIQCACVDTFQAAFPQCVDCFIVTNQTSVLQTNDLPSLVTGMRQACSLFSTLFGGVASTNRQLPSQTPITVPAEETSAALRLSENLPTLTIMTIIAVSSLGLLVGAASISL